MPPTSSDDLTSTVFSFTTTTVYIPTTAVGTAKAKAKPTCTESGTSATDAVTASVDGVETVTSPAVTLTVNKTLTHTLVTFLTSHPSQSANSSDPSPFSVSGSGVFYTSTLTSTITSGSLTKTITHTETVPFYNSTGAGILPTAGTGTAGAGTATGAAGGTATTGTTSMVMTGTMTHGGKTTTHTGSVGASASASGTATAGAAKIRAEVLGYKGLEVGWWPTVVLVMAVVVGGVVV